MNKSSLAKLLAALVMLGLAAYSWLRYHRSQQQPEEQAYFYDQSLQKLFAAPRIAVPPIRGLDNEEADAVRAIVISTSGNPNDQRHRRIAYLEKYSPELKQQIESRQGHDLTAVDSKIGRVEAQALTYVRRVNESDWHPVNSAEAEKIMTEWQVPGPGGQIPVVCLP